MKIINDKYYTPISIAEHCYDKTMEIIGKDNISEIIEPSAGDGSFIKTRYCDKAYDIQPEHDNIIKADFLTLDILYKKGRLIIGNPPFGTRNTLAVKFYKKSVIISDYIAFILSISQYKCNEQMYEFDLIYSEDLGKNIFTDRNLHCCFNIYKRPCTGELNKKHNWKLKDVNITEYRRGGNYLIPYEYDYAICAWGASTGRKISYPGQYAQEIYIKVNNQKYYTEIMNIMNNFDYKYVCNEIATPHIHVWRIYKYLKEQIPELE